jgi:hypothetical protein
VNHFASPQFWRLYCQLSPEVRALANKNFQLLKADPKYPSLHVKKIDKLWAVRVGAHYRALGVDKPEGVVWFWIPARTLIMTSCFHRNRSITTSHSTQPLDSILRIL